MSSPNEMKMMITAARQNNGQAQYDLGMAYLNGDGIPQDYAEAYFWLTVCSSTPNVFRTPSPDELAADASIYITDEVLLSNLINRAILWLAQHGSPVAEDY